MFGTINIINPEPFLKAFESMHCKEMPFSEINFKDFEIKQNETKPIDGAILPDKFPNCCAGHKELFQIGITHLLKFPNCCENHKKLNRATWFNKTNYSYLPLKLVKSVTYTMQCIDKCINNNNWHKEITDYIEYTIMSFGQLPAGYGAPLGLSLYLHNVASNLKSNKNIPNDKCVILKNYIKSKFEPEKEIEQTDLNLLIQKYREWLRIFPFELSFFADLKPHFEKQLPILTGPPDTNMYNGLTAFKLKTKKELLVFLIDTTLYLIRQINTSYLFQNKLLLETEKIQIEILVATRKLELEELDKTDRTDKKEYIKLLKTWLHGERKFLLELKPIFNSLEKRYDFISDLIDGIKTLQKNDTNEQCILNIRQNLSGKETSFRYWFKNFFAARYQDAIVTAEEEQGTGRIDLKVSNKIFGDKIIEFKGWWNYDKRNSVEQICSYLTDFENTGYVFMINHLQNKSIVDDFRKVIETPDMKYIPNSWKEVRFGNTDFSYYESKHKFGIKVKTVCHFIFNVFF